MTRTYPHSIPVAVPDGQSGLWAVETFTVTAADENSSRVRAALDRKLLRDIVKAGTYKRLVQYTDASMHRGGETVMSNVDMEIKTNWEFLREARGRILINGLGLGMTLAYLLDFDDVTSITVVEASADVIRLVAPTYVTDRRVAIVHADAFEYRPRGQYDYVWHDIWTFISADNLDGMKKLHRRYGRRTRWQASWRRGDCEDHARRCR